LLVKASELLRSDLSALTSVVLDVIFGISESLSEKGKSISQCCSVNDYSLSVGKSEMSLMLDSVVFVSRKIIFSNLEKSADNCAILLHDS
jgi:hypothetical protein